MFVLELKLAVAHCHSIAALIVFEITAFIRTDRQTDS